MNAIELFQAGDLGGAIEAATQRVKSAPTDRQYRTLLFTLLAFQGDLPRALKQLDVLDRGGPENEWGVQVYRNLIQAEQQRRALFDEGGEPQYLRDAPAYAAHFAACINALAGGDLEAAQAHLAAGREAQPQVRCRQGGVEHDVICDWDDRLAPFLEFVLIGDYLWVPLDQLRSIDVMPIENPRDIIWTPARIQLLDETQLSGYVPALYPGSWKHEDNEIKLGRATDWIELAPELTAGVGTKQFLVGEQTLALRDLLDVSLLTADGPASEEAGG